MVGFYLPVLLLVILFFLAYLTIADSPDYYHVVNRTWGFDHLLFFGTGVQVGYLVVLAFVLFPPGNLLCQRLVLSVAFTIRGWLGGRQQNRGRILLYLTVSVLGFFLFYRFQVRYHLLGDFDMRVGEVIHGKFIYTEYLSMVWLHLLLKMFSGTGIVPEQLFRLYSCFSGALFVFIACLLSHEAGRTPAEKTGFFFALVASSLLLVFCGYAEIYSSPVVLLLLYMYASFRYLHHRSGFLYPLLVLILALGFHLINAAALPSLFVLYYLRNKDRFPFIKRLSGLKLAVVLSVIGIAGLVVLFASGSRFIMPLRPQGEVLRFLSGKHLWELLNGQILSSGLNLFVTVFILIRMARKKTGLSAEGYFLFFLAGGLLLLVCVCDLQRGSGDWDIMAFPAIPLNLLCVLLCLRVLSFSGQYLAVVLTAFNLLNALLWIDINHTERSVAKTDGMFKNDPGSYYLNRAEDNVRLAIWFKNRKLYATAQRFAKASCDEPGTNDLRGCLLYAECLDRLGKPDEAAAVYDWLLTEKKQPVYEAYIFLLDHHAKKKGSEEKVVFYLRAFYDSFAADPAPYTTSDHFSPGVMSGLISALYQIEKENAEPERLKQMLQVLNSLKGKP